MDLPVKVILTSFIYVYLIQLNFLSRCQGFENHSNNSISCVVKLRGLPWTATVDDVVNFFDDCNIKNGTMGVHLVITKEGRPSGVAYVDLESQDDVELAYKKDGQYLGERYIEVFQATVSEMQRTIRRSKQSIQRAISDACVRVRGLPYKTSEQDVINFFEGLDILPDGVFLVHDDQGRTTGEAYVQFRDQEEAERALKRHMGRLYHRYIEVFRSSLGELRLAQSPQTDQEEYLPPPPPPQTQYRGPVMNNRGYQILRPLRFSGYPDRYIRQQWNGARYPQYDQNHGRQRDPEPRYHQGEGRERKSNALHMRGLPYNATRDDITEFFSPIEIIGIDFHFTSRGKPNGQADVIFKTKEDLQEALKKDKNYMKHRYIELFE
ncbi:heterogeneous nuclear ribonucleoprotein H2-like [Macrosteles quadrilineatus]|uniref:heterogeneous nuclear ribonucleoprotein H2-like n=1 Tax=Macrosteles quadrilineatus TaxID=74068 RepID=UPI0023E0B3BB|nr:heterogeneous nuclear ribonucleoprotein H2-like [Macrosteles quadrilineatus]